MLFGQPLGGQAGGGILRVPGGVSNIGVRCGHPEAEKEKCTIAQVGKT
jgi:hypothetical protein